MKKIGIFLPSRCQNVSQELDTTGTGAREQIADWLADQLAPKAEVHVFTNQEIPVHKPNLHYVPQELAGVMLTTYEWDALISFDFPSVATIEGIRDNVKRLVVAQNYFEIPPEGFTPEVFDLIDAWVYPSRFALENCSRVNDSPLDRGVVIPYTYDERFYRDHWKEHDSIRFIYANQAESGLSNVLKMWPDIRAEYPDSTLTVACPVDEFVEQIQWSHSIQSEVALDIRDLIGQDGVRYIGRQGRRALSKEFYASDILLYPAQPLAPQEIGSLPILQACTAGVVPIFTPVDALEELYGHAGVMAPSDSENFLQAINTATSDLDHYRENAQLTSDANFTFGNAIELWREVIC